MSTLVLSNLADRPAGATVVDLGEAPGVRHAARLVRAAVTDPDLFRDHVIHSVRGRGPSRTELGGGTAQCGGEAASGGMAPAVNSPSRPSAGAACLSACLFLLVGGCGDDGPGGAGISDTQVSLPDATAPDATAPHSDTDDDGASGLDADGPDPVAPLQLAFEEVVLDVKDDAATDLVFLPDGAGFLVLQKKGRINHYTLDPSGDAATLQGGFDVPGVDSTADCGLISAEFDPGWGDTNQHLFVGSCSSVTHSRVTRHEFATSDYDAAADSTVQVVEVGHPDAPEPWHNVGSVRFGADGWLYALFGDKAMGEPAQDTSNAMGSLVRLDVGSFDPDAGDLVPDVYAWGLRSPWKGVFDAAGRFWLGDVGAADIEEIDVVTARDQNFAWPDWEGPCGSDCDGFTQPVTWWDRSAAHPYALDDPDTAPTDRRVAWVGVEHDPTTAGGDPYDGRWTGRMLAGDFCAGWIRALELGGPGTDSSDALVADTSAGHLEGVTGIAQGPDGYVYLTTYGNCFTFPLQPTTLYRAVLAD